MRALLLAFCLTLVPIAHINALWSEPAQGRACALYSPSEIVLVQIPLPNEAMPASVTLLARTSSLPFSVQLVLAQGWREQVAKRVPNAIGKAWWTLDGCGVTFVALPDEFPRLMQAVKVVLQQQDWDTSTTNIARRQASQELRRWQKEPRTWLLWLARLSALNQPFSELEPDQPLRVRTETVAKVLQTLRQRQSLLIVCNGNEVKVPARLSYWRVSLQPRAPSLKVSLPHTRRAHWLRWCLTEGDVAVGMVVSELFGGGTGSAWFQFLRGEQPLAYHAWAQWQLTPADGELVLYAATTPERLTKVQQRAQMLLQRVTSDKWRVTNHPLIGEADLERARRMAEWHYRQITAEPMELSMALAVWFASGRDFKEWQQLPERIKKVSIEDVDTFIRRLPTVATEIVATGGSAVK